METILKILDTGLDYYSIEPTKVILGRQYDNDADSIKIEIPEQEKSSLCTMIITNQLGQVIDHISMENGEYLITSAISQNKIIKIGFSFSRKDGYVKNSAIIVGQFLEAQKPDDFVPVQPEQKKSIDYLIKYGFTDSKLVGNELQFFNSNGEKVVAFDLSPFTQEQSDLGEIDESSETFVKGKKTSNLVNDGEDGTSPYATQQYVDSRKIDMDTQMSDTSENAVQNKVIKNYVDDGLSEKLSTMGGSISGNLDISGNLNVDGKTVSRETETLRVKDNIIVTNADGVELLKLSGLGIKTNANNVYGIVYDPISNSVKLGIGTMDSNGEFTFNENEGEPVAVRDDSSLFVDGHLIMWDSTRNKFIDSGKSLENIDVKTDNVTITKDDSNQLQSVALKDTTDNTTITASTIRKAITIRRHS